MTSSAADAGRHPSAWRAADFRSADDWTVVLPPAVRDELVAEATRVDRASNASICRHVVDAERLPATRALMASLEREIMQGRGFVLVRGLGDGLDDGMLKACYWVLGSVMGRPISQNAHGERLCDVMDIGRVYGEKQVRTYQTNAHLKFHTDRSDLVGLMCVRRAMKGGRSSIASAVSAFEQLQRERPDLVPPLFAGMHYMNVEEGGDSSYKRVPVFSITDGVLSCRYQRNNFDTAMRQGAPYTETEKAALDALDRAAASEALRLDMDLERGDIQLINNYTTLHSRTEFEDFPEPERKRCMSRLWLRSPTHRPTAAHFADYGGVPATLAPAN